MGLEDERGGSAPSPAGPTSNDEVRLRCLQLGAQLVEASDASTIQFAVGQVSVADVAQAMGVSRPAIYKLWPSQQDFRVDLAVAMVATTHEPLLPGDLAFDEGDRFEASVRRRFEPILDRQLEIQEDHAFRASLLAYADHDGVRSRCAAIERACRTRDAERLAAALQACGRQIVAPLTPLDLATLLRCAADGSVLLLRSEPEGLDLWVTVDDEPPCRLLGYMASCLLGSLTEPLSEHSSHAASPAAGEEGGTDLPTWTARQQEVLDRAAELARASLRAGTSPQLGALGQLTLDRVARQLGEHRRTLYRLWPDHAAFRLGVLEFLSARNRLRFTRAFDATIPEALEHPERLTMTVAEGITSAMYQLDEPAPIPRFAMFPYTGLEAVALIRASLHEDYRGSSHPRIELLLDAFGWTPRHDLTAAHLNAMLGIFGLGGERMHHMDPTAIRRDLPYLDGRFSTIAIAHHALEQHTLQKEPGA